MVYVLSIEISGAGEDPQHRSHWGFTMHKPSSPIGDLFHVEVIDIDRLWFQFESRMGTGLRTMDAIGEVKLGELSEQQRQQAIQVIKSSPAPRDGKKRCQDWVYDTLLSLDIEELVPSGTCHFWKGMVGKPARAIQATAGVNWMTLK
ncbi:uncharacterized protein N7518_010206 [Penicillium psychrosexuale]|uniref:uncharacterized protein n=1 Tax=Penicillium psychrosexuale TaxID=1002107 RepID=UPI002544F682|nr:uncharacterized protein N7518_010206 [Penicillium psychrosexuale]KAJ5781723.1 hypothetical protein N7518_010206 [Penicillium psychrosexuale]